MFSFFRKKKPQQTPQRDLFDELFPLSNDLKQQIDAEVAAIQTKMHGEDGLAEIRAYRRQYTSQLTILQNLEFDTFNWQLHDSNASSQLYYDDFGDTLEISIMLPNGEMKRETSSSQMPVFRNWMRSIALEQSGGIVFCEEFSLNNGLTGSESILKIPRQEAPGMDYIYVLQALHYKEQKIYRITIRVNEMSPTGMRDNIFIQPISLILGLDFMEMAKLYNQDPYDKNFKEGNTMNLSERQEFDYLFPFHPLSIIRNEIMPQLKYNLRFI